MNEAQNVKGIFGAIFYICVTSNSWNSEQIQGRIKSSEKNRDDIIENPNIYSRVCIKPNQFCLISFYLGFANNPTLGKLGSGSGMNANDQK